MVVTGLDYIHGLDMAYSDVPHLVHHGKPGTYLLTIEEVGDRFAHWLALCADYDDGASD